MNAALVLCAALLTACGSADTPEAPGASSTTAVSPSPTTTPSPSAASASAVIDPEALLTLKDLKKVTGQNWTTPGRKDLGSQTVIRPLCGKPSSQTTALGAQFIQFSSNPKNQAIVIVTVQKWPDGQLDAVWKQARTTVAACKSFAANGESNVVLDKVATDDAITLYTGSMSNLIQTTEDYRRFGDIVVGMRCLWDPSRTTKFTAKSRLKVFSAAIRQAKLALSLA